MGCDYYIETNLCIFYKDNTSNYVNLIRDRGYFTDCDDFIMNMEQRVSLKNNKMTEWEKIKQFHLLPRTLPIIIYTNHSFTNNYLLNEYKEIIEFEMTNNDYTTWDDIKEIVILEERYEQ